MSSSDTSFSPAGIFASRAALDHAHRGVKTGRVDAHPVALAATHIAAQSRAIGSLTTSHDAAIARAEEISALYDTLDAAHIALRKRFLSLVSDHATCGDRAAELAAELSVRFEAIREREILLAQKEALLEDQLAKERALREAAAAAWAIERIAASVVLSTTREKLDAVAEDCAALWARAENADAAVIDITKLSKAAEIRANISQKREEVALHQLSAATDLIATLQADIRALRAALAAVPDGWAAGADAGLTSRMLALKEKEDEVARLLAELGRRDAENLALRHMLEDMMPTEPPSSSSQELLQGGDNTTNPLPPLKEKESRRGVKGVDVDTKPPAKERRGGEGREPLQDRPIVNVAAGTGTLVLAPPPSSSKPPAAPPISALTASLVLRARGLVRLQGAVFFDCSKNTRNTIATGKPTQTPNPPPPKRSNEMIDRSSLTPTRALSVILTIFESLDEEGADTLIPLFGYGALARSDDAVGFGGGGVFSLSSQPCVGANGTMKSLNARLSKGDIEASESPGPGLSPSIRRAILLTQSDASKTFTACIILTHSGTAPLCDTLALLDNASKTLPLVIICVGVGDGPWDDMITLTNKSSQRLFNNFNVSK